MFPRFSDAIAAVNELKELGLIEDYAIFGAVAQTFWDEAIPTYDLDVLVLLQQATGGILISLEPIYRWAKERGYPEVSEHLVICEIPVQFVPAPDALSDEAVREAAVRQLNGVPVRVVRPEYLIALWLTPPANKPSRKERAAKLRESGQVDEAFLADLMRRYNLSW